MRGDSERTVTITKTTCSSWFTPWPLLRSLHWLPVWQRINCKLAKIVTWLLLSNSQATSLMWSAHTVSLTCCDRPHRSFCQFRRTIWTLLLVVSIDWLIDWLMTIVGWLYLAVASRIKCMIFAVVWRYTFMHLFRAIESASENFQEWLKDVGLNKVFVFYLVYVHVCFSCICHC